MEHEKMKLIIDSNPHNESFARAVIGAFISRLDPTLDELSDIQTSVSEAVTNSIVHAYRGNSGEVQICSYIFGNDVTIEISDEGCGIENISLARQPFYSSCPDMERSGMGFTIMEALMDSITVESTVDKGTIVTLKKKISKSQDEIN